MAEPNQNASQQKRSVNFTPQEHQQKLIAQGICPRTLKPMTPKYFMSKEFVVYHSTDTDMVYYGRPRFGEVLRAIWKEVRGHLSYFYTSRLFEWHVKINKRYPVEKLKPFN